ncbi:hypothetical protein [Hamadaea tsunoensis]|uniref:hypothetical protein n=1 Tax=Hamadaea tsunoensis TaxID=53368 RepID=UPI0004046143|nr:hypothetical protein [Hamadaea tsunoensis]
MRSTDAILRTGAYLLMLTSVPLIAGTPAAASSPSPSAAPPAASPSPSPLPAPCGDDDITGPTAPAGQAARQPNQAVHNGTTILNTTAVSLTDLTIEFQIIPPARETASPSPQPSATMSPTPGDSPDPGHAAEDFPPSVYWNLDGSAWRQADLTWVARAEPYWATAAESLPALAPGSHHSVNVWMSFPPGAPEGDYAAYASFRSPRCAAALGQVGQISFAYAPAPYAGQGHRSGGTRPAGTVPTATPSPAAGLVTTAAPAPSPSSSTPDLAAGSGRSGLSTLLAACVVVGIALAAAGALVRVVRVNRAVRDQQDGSAQETPSTP